MKYFNTKINMNLNNNQRLSPSEAADYLGFKESTLASWRCTNKMKIPYIKLGRKVAYYKDDLDAFIDSYKVN